MKHGKSPQRPPYPMPDPKWEDEPDPSPTNAIWLVFMFLGVALLIGTGIVLVNNAASARICLKRSCPVGSPKWIDGECYCAVPAKENP